MKIEVFLFVLLSFVVRLVIGYGMSDGDLLSYRVGEELRLERDLIVSNKVNNRLTLPAGTFLYHLSSSQWNDVLVIKIIFEEGIKGIIGEITSPIQEERKVIQLTYQKDSRADERIHHCNQSLMKW